MRAVGTILVLVTAAVLQSTDTMQACGEKFLVVGRGVSFHRAYAAIYPASIVLYAQPQRGASKAMRDPKFLAELKKAGHRVLLVDSDAALARALESDRVDLVLTDSADADRMSRQAAASPSGPEVLPVMYEPTKTEAKAVEARFRYPLKTSDRADRYLSTIDDAMKARADQRKKK